MAVAVTTAEVLDAVARTLGLAVLSGSVALLAAFAYRWYVVDGIPDGIAVLLGVGTVAIWLNTRAALGEAIGGATDFLTPRAALFTVGAFFAGGVAANLGRRAGDRLAIDLTSVTGTRVFDTDVSQLVRTVGRVTRVTIPDDIDDVDGYDPVPRETKATMAGTTLLFPRRLTVGELTDRLSARLKDDYGVGHVEVKLSGEGTIDYLAVGSRAAGIGPTLAPGDVAVSVRADPAFSASAGDLVQLWTGGEDPSHVVSGELRAAVEDVATIAVEEADADRIDPETRYRIVTLPTQPHADREFASLLRTADESTTAVTVQADSALIGSTVADLDVTVAAVDPAGDEDVILSTDSRPIGDGDTLYAIGLPDALRSLEASARAGAMGAAERRETEPST